MGEVATMKLHVEYEMEEDGRWIAETPEMPASPTTIETMESAPA
jgi:predicted RNase H-like HicB family nuclease